MNQLIKVRQGTVGDTVQQVVDARELHSFLEVQTRFNDWITNRIQKYQLRENLDFGGFTENLVKPSGGRPAQEYLLTLNTAKELAMVENNDKGRQARRYFIECERLLLEGRQQTASPPDNLGRKLSPDEVLHLGQVLNLRELAAATGMTQGQVAEQLYHATQTHQPLLPSPEVLATLKQFRDVLNGLDLSQLNHSVRPELLAINLNELYALAGDRLPPRSHLMRALPFCQQPAFLAKNRVTRSRLDSITRKCWVFLTGREPQA